MHTEDVSCSREVWGEEEEEEEEAMGPLLFSSLHRALFSSRGGRPPAAHTLSSVFIPLVGWRDQYIDSMYLCWKGQQ